MGLEHDEPALTSVMKCYATSSSPVFKREKKAVQWLARKIIKYLQKTL